MGKNEAFPPPPHSLQAICAVVLLFELPVRNNKHPNFEWNRGIARRGFFLPWLLANYEVVHVALSRIVGLFTQKRTTRLISIIKILELSWRMT